MGLENEIDYKQYLSIIYGEDVKILFDKYVFIPSDKNKELVKNKEDKVYAKGKLLYTNGSKVITEDIDNVIELINTEIIGYAIFLSGDIKELYSVKVGNRFIRKIAILNQNNAFEIGNLTCQFYNKIHPEIIIELDKLRYIGKFEDGTLKRFIKIG